MSVLTQPRASWTTLTEHAPIARGFVSRSRAVECKGCKKWFHAKCQEKTEDLVCCCCSHCEMIPKEAATRERKLFER